MKFKLINGISFENNCGVALFQQVTNYALRLYSIGREQYSFDNNVNLNNLILKQFEDINVELQNLGTICHNEKIKLVGAIVIYNLG